MNKERLMDYVVASYRKGVRDWLREHDATHKELADRVGFDKQYVTETVSGNRMKKGPTLSNAVLMALATDKSLDELCGLDKLRERVSDEQGAR